MTHLIEDAKSLLNVIFREAGLQRGYGEEWAGLRYVIDEINKGNGLYILTQLNTQIHGQYMGSIRRKHLSDISEGDIELDYNHQKHLAEEYIKKFGGELADIQPKITAKIYEKADEKIYHPKPEDEHH